MTVRELYEMIENCNADAEVRIAQLYGIVGSTEVTGMDYNKNTVTLTDEDLS